MTWEFFARWLSIVILDLTLAGDNAVVIALAVRSLPRRQQRRGIVWGAVGAVTLRAAVTVLAARLLTVPLLQLGGGLLLLWIAWKLLRNPPGAEEGQVNAAAGLWQAIKIIVLADFIMSTDNMLAVAAASAGSFPLVLFGLGLSIPIIFCCSALVARMMNRWPWLATLGAAILGYVAGEMIAKDALVRSQIEPLAMAVEHSLPVLLAAAVVVAGQWHSRRRRRIERERMNRAA